MSEPAGNQHLLFLCTGNYYRSRFVEELFNHHAIRERLPWKAQSRGLSEDFSQYRNPGPIAAVTLAELTRLGVQPLQASRFPLYVELTDFDRFDRIIALSREEHTPMVSRRFAERLHQVEFWEVEDVEFVSAEFALRQMIEKVEALVSQLRAEPR